MTTTKTRKPLAGSAKSAEKPGPLATYWAEDVMRAHPGWAYLFGPGPVREPDEAELAALEARKDDPAFAALYALSARAKAGEDIALLPVTPVDAGPAPELEAPEVPAGGEPAGEPEPDPYEQHFGPVRRRDLLARWSPPAYAQEAAAAHVAAQEPPAFTPDLDAKWGGRAGGEVTEGGTAVIPAADAGTDVLDLDEDGGVKP